jgi:hypothetical protein
VAGPSSFGSTQLDLGAILFDSSYNGVFAIAIAFAALADVELEVREVAYVKLLRNVLAATATGPTARAQPAGSAAATTCARGRPRRSFQPDVSARTSRAART